MTVIGPTGTHDVAPAVNVALRLPAEVSGQKPSAVYDVRMDPAAMREQARQLRDGAATVRQKGAALDDGIRAVATHYPHTTGGVWVGSAADTFFTDLGTARTTVGTLATDLDGYAHDCEVRAGHLENEADDLEARQKQAHHH